MKTLRTVLMLSACLALSLAGFSADSFGDPGTVRLLEIQGESLSREAAPVGPASRRHSRRIRGAAAHIPQCDQDFRSMSGFRISHAWEEQP